jgi:hypothetical protein
MTNEQLKELLARAIANGSPDLYETVQTVIEALAPMMREMVGSAEWYMRCAENLIKGNASQGYSEAKPQLEKIIASLPDCWREKGGV